MQRMNKHNDVGVGRLVGWCASLFPLGMLLAVLISTTGCEFLVDALIDSAFGEDLEITSTNAPPGGVGIYYRWEIYAEVKNEPFDSWYRYNWAFQRGELPPGLEFSDEGDHAVVAGMPTATGRYEFVAYVYSPELRDFEEWGETSVWSSSDKKTFQIEIRE
jgi:hypothetical protein